MKIRERHALQNHDVLGIIRGAAITSAGPIMAAAFVMVALMISLSRVIAWQREGAVFGTILFGRIIYRGSAEKND